MRRFTKDCHQAGVVIHGTFILGLPVETQADDRADDQFCEGTGRVQPASLARRAVSRHGTLRDGQQNGWFVKKDKTDLVEDDGLQQSALEYPGLDKEEIFEERGSFLSHAIICVRNRFCASSRRCWKTRTFWCAVAAKATSFSGVSVTANTIWPDPKRRWVRRNLSPKKFWRFFRQTVLGVHHQVSICMPQVQPLVSFA